MHRLTVVVLTLLVIIAFVFPPVFAHETKRETNADRLRRGYPPLPPSRRDAAKRTGPSGVPPQTPQT
jgi:hypothetical protein